MMRMTGSLSSLAMRSARIGFMGMVASAEPPRTVKSSPSTTTGAASLARPMTQLAGVSVFRLPVSSYLVLLATAPTSWKLPESTRRSMRSRTVSRPPVLTPHLVGCPSRAPCASRCLSSSSPRQLMFPPRLQLCPGSHAAGVEL
jgi:hypothetical protein